MTKEQIAEIRSFNRIYTSLLGLMDRHILNSNFSLPEVRVMFELYHSPNIQANELIERFSIDKGFLSRILKGLEKNGIIKRIPLKEDRRANQVTLTSKGEREFQALNAASDNQIREIFKSVPIKELNKLLNSMKTIRGILNASRYERES